MATGLNNLTTIIKRLEAATSRLEDIASAAQPHGGPHPPVAAISEGPSTNGTAAETTPLSPSAVIQPAAVLAFDSLIEDDLKSFAKLSEQLGGLVAEQGAAFYVAFKAQREVLLIASKSKEPSQSSPVFMEILKDLQHGMETVNNVRDKNRKSPQENHLSMVADGVGMLAWVTIKPAPDKYVAEVLGGAQFYGNKILTTFKDKEPNNIEWVRSFVKLCGALKTFIKQHYAKGLEWNSAGVPPEEALKTVKTGSPTTNSSAAIEASRGSAAPPPPPPLPVFDMPPPAAHSHAPSQTGGNMGAIFDDLNRGNAVTSGLRKVDQSEMTHKNPALRSQGTVPVSESKPSAALKKVDSATAKKPPRKALEGNMWTIENYDNYAAPITVDVEKHHSLLISKCKSSTIQINGKANAVSVDNCTRLDLLVDTLVSSVGVVNSSNFRMQVTGSLPSIQLDKVDGAIVYLSKDSLGTEVFTSKCTSVNVTLPPASEQEDSVECPIPEQLRSWIENGKLMSEIVTQEG